MEIVLSMKHLIDDFINVRFELDWRENVLMSILPEKNVSYVVNKLRCSLNWSTVEQSLIFMRFELILGLRRDIQLFVLLDYMHLSLAQLVQSISRHQDHCQSLFPFLYLYICIHGDKYGEDEKKMLFLAGNFFEKICWGLDHTFRGNFTMCSLFCVLFNSVIFVNSRRKICFKVSWCGRPATSDILCTCCNPLLSNARITIDWGKQRPKYIYKEILSPCSYWRTQTYTEMYFCIKVSVIFISLDEPKFEYQSKHISSSYTTIIQYRSIKHSFHKTMFDYFFVLEYWSKYWQLVARNAEHAIWNIVLFNPSLRCIFSWAFPTAIANDRPATGTYHWTGLSNSSTWSIYLLWPRGYRSSCSQQHNRYHWARISRSFWLFAKKQSFVHELH